MIFIREDLNYAIHQIELSDFIFTIDNLSKQLKNRVQFGIVGKHASHPRAQNTRFYQSEKVRPVQELWEAQYLCTCQGQHPLSGWGHAGSCQPNNIWGEQMLSFLKLQPHTSQSCIAVKLTIYRSRALQDHAARSFLSPASPFPGQVPADQKARYQASTHDQQRVWMIHKHYKTCMTRNHALMIHFTFMTCKHCTCMLNMRAGSHIYFNQPDVAFAPIACSSQWNFAEQIPQHPQPCQHLCRGSGSNSFSQFQNQSTNRIMGKQQNWQEYFPSAYGQ